MAEAPETFLEDEGAEEQLRQRLAILLLSYPRHAVNYTEALDQAAWMIREAAHVGWVITIEAV